MHEVRFLKYISNSFIENELLENTFLTIMTIKWMEKVSLTDVRLSLKPWEIFLFEIMEKWISQNIVLSIWLKDTSFSFMLKVTMLGKDGFFEVENSITTKSKIISQHTTILLSKIDLIGHLIFLKSKLFVLNS